MVENRNDNNEKRRTMETFTIQLTSPALYDRLHILSAEYSVSMEHLASTAVKRLLDDVDFVRALRTGKPK